MCVIRRNLVEGQQRFQEDSANCDETFTRIGKNQVDCWKTTLIRMKFQGHANNRGLKWTSISMLSPMVEFLVGTESKIIKSLQRFIRISKLAWETGTLALWSYAIIGILESSARSRSYKRAIWSRKARRVRRTWDKSWSRWSRLTISTAHESCSCSKTT